MVDSPDPRLSDQEIGGLDFRIARPDNDAFLAEMVIAACFPPWSSPSVEQARAFPHAARWLSPPPGSGDVIVVGCLGNRPIGAAIGLCFNNLVPCWGVIAADIPELAIAITAPERGRGYGRAILDYWLQCLLLRGHRSASLTVGVINSAGLRLYARCGFAEVERDARRVLMRWDAPESIAG